MIDYKLHIPGPVDVSPEAYQAMSTRVMGHRSPDFVDSHVMPTSFSNTRPKTLFFSQLQCMESWKVLCEICAKKTLCCMCGAFSDKWLDAGRCGKEADGLEVEWGSHIDPVLLDQKLSSGEYDLVTLVHNETPVE